MCLCGVGEWCDECNLLTIEHKVDLNNFIQFTFSIEDLVPSLKKSAVFIGGQEYRIGNKPNVSQGE